MKRQMGARIPAMFLVAVAATSCWASGNPSTLTLSVAEHSFGPAGLAGLMVEIREPGRVYHVRGVEFQSTPQNQSPHTEPIRVGDHGTLQVRAALIEGVDTVAQGELAIALRPESEWNVSFERGVADPLTKCFGCVESRRFEIAPAFRKTPDEAFWMVVARRRASRAGSTF